MRQRKEWAAQVAAGAKAEAEKAELWAAVVAAKQEAKETLERLTKEFHAKTRELEGRYQEAMLAIEQAFAARRQLLATAPPLAARRLRQLQSEALPRLSSAIAAKETTLEGLRSTLGIYERGIEANAPPLNMTPDEAEKRADGFRHDVARLERDVASLRGEHAALTAEASTLEAAAVEPWPEGCPTLR